MEARTARTRQTILLLMLCVSLFVAVGFAHNFIPSESMEPNLRPGDHIVTMREWLAYPFGAMPSRGDVVVFRMPPSSSDADDSDLQVGGNVIAATRSKAATSEEDDSSEDKDTNDSNSAGNSKAEILIKRVVGLPGDLIQLKGNTLYVNNQPVQENYCLIPVDESEGYAFPYAVYQPLRVPPGQLFVLGDNRNNSDDGRFWGTLPRANIMGRYVRTLYHESKYDVAEAVIPIKRK